jgi:hypothetical protein
MRLRELYDRIEECNDRYWNIPKDHRIKHGLRAEVGSSSLGYSGARVIELCRDLLSRAFRDLYPFKSEVFVALITPGLPEEFNSPEEVVAAVEPMVAELEKRLDAYEASRN